MWVLRVRARRDWLGRVLPVFALLVVLVAVVGGCSSCRRSQSGASTDVAEKEGEIEPTLVAADDETMMLAFMHVVGKRADSIVVRVSRDAGVGWHEEQTIRASGATSVADPSLAVDAMGNVDLVFLAFTPDKSGEPTGMSLFVAHAPRDTLRFDAPTKIPTDAPQIDKPWSAVDAFGRLLVVDRWQTPAARGIDVHTRNQGGNFTRTTLAVGAAFDGTLPTICASKSGAPRVLWIDPDPGPNARVVATVRDDIGMWSVPTTISNADEPVAMEAPSCVVDEAGAEAVYGVTRAPFDSAASPVLDGIVWASLAVEAPSEHRRVDVARLMHPIVFSVPLATGPEHVAAVLLTKDDGTTSVALNGWPASSRRSTTVSPRRDDPTFPGDYFGAASAGGRIVTATVETKNGVRRVVVETLER